MTKINLVILLIFINCTPSFALTGQDLNDFCVKNSSERLSCVALIAGTLDGLHYGATGGVAFANKALLDKFEQNKTDIGVVYGYCPPLGNRVNYGQFVSIVKKYLNDHPERLHETAASLVLRAIRGAFPC